MRPGEVALAVLACVLVSAPATAQDTSADPRITPGYASEVRPDEPIELHLDRPLSPAAGRLAILIGQTDWSGLFEATERGLAYRPVAVQLAPGDHEVAVYLVTPGNDWRLLGRFPLRVIAERAAPRRTEMTPVLDVANKGQIAQAHRPPSNAPARLTFQDFTVNAGLESSTLLGGWAASSHVNLFGVTNRIEALRFGELAAKAPLVDLADYQVRLDRRWLALSVGHVTFGGNRQLFQDFASRGALLTTRMGSRADVALSMVSGSELVGWTNFLGLQEPDHRVFGATAGFEALRRPGALRLEASVLDGRILPVAGYGQGAITDAERSRGGGLRVVATATGGRFQLDGGYSWSSFTNPADPLLAQDATLVSVAKESRDARYLDVSYAAIQTSRLNLVALFRHESVDPLFGSVMADLKSDLVQNTAEVAASLGPATARVSFLRSSDNLDDIASILKTYTELGQIDAVLPVGWAFGRSSADPGWWPVLSVTLNRIHQRAAGVPENAGFSSPAQTPDQIVSDRTVGLEWQRPMFRAGYRLNRMFQNSRQAGKQQSDLKHFIHQLSVAVMPLDRLDVQVDLALEQAENVELARTDLTRRVGINAMWRITSRTSLVGLLSTTFLKDDGGVQKSRDDDYTLEFSQSIPLTASGKPAAQFFIRSARQSATRLDRLFGIDERLRLWTFNTGFSVSLF